MSIKISGAGCSLIDSIYTNMDFSSPAFKKYSSLKIGDGGLSPGKLVFSDEFEAFCGKPFHDALAECVGGRNPAAFNLGGPAIVALINAAQILHKEDISFHYHGTMADDETGHHILDILNKLPVDIKNYRIVPGESPTTVVLSDPAFANGKGERAFINSIAAADAIMPSDLGSDFFDADIVLFGGTGLVPHLHDGLTGLCRRGKENSCLTIVNTVFDFRSEKKAPEKRWPLGDSDETYRDIDLLIVDMEEGIRMSGTTTPEESLEWFRQMGVASTIITCGAKRYHMYAGGEFFSDRGSADYPVCHQVDVDIAEGRVTVGDTTGCGDNFVGGVLASVADQLQKGGKIDLLEASSWGVASGGQACLYVGGTYLEESPGEKREQVEGYYRSYRKQIQL